MVQKRTTEPRSEYVMIRTDPKTKQGLQEIADKKGWSLSLVGHTALQEWLRVQSDSNHIPRMEDVPFANDIIEIMEQE